MKFYIDFEATQFSNKIISIGCIAENGQTFNSLVKPKSKKNDKIKLGSFITELTGITDEMIAAAPSADDVFNAFFDWICEQNDNTMPQYFCYGDNDAVFIETTAKTMTDTRAISFAMSIKSMLTDFAPETASYFGLKQVGLHRVYTLMQEEAGPQKHDALEDAMMLMFIEENLHKLTKPEDVVNLPAPAARPKKEKRKVPEIFNQWPGSPKKKDEANTGADETNWVVMAENTGGTKIKYFDSMETACLWAIKYLAPGKSPKNSEDMRYAEKRILKSNNISGCRQFGYRWVVKEGEN